MNILAFDTCLDKMYVALGDEKEIFAAKIIETTETTYHSAFLISTIKEILKEQNLKPADLDVIATNMGPGSFTGIRACTTVARVMAQSLNLKAIGVSSLEIISRINKSKTKTLIALDARKEMAYTAIFEGNKQILEPQVVLLEDLKSMIEKENYFILTDDKLQKIIGGVSYQQDDHNLGENLIRITQEKINSDIQTDWKKLLPLYIQPPALHIKKQA